MLALQEELNQLEKLEMKSESIDNVINSQDSKIIAMMSEVEGKAISNDSDLPHKLDSDDEESYEDDFQASDEIQYEDDFE